MHWRISVLCLLALYIFAFIPVYANVWYADAQQTILVKNRTGFLTDFYNFDITKIDSTSWKICYSIRDENFIKNCSKNLIKCYQNYFANISFPKWKVISFLTDFFENKRLPYEKITEGYSLKIENLSLEKGCFILQFDKFKPKEIFKIGYASITFVSEYGYNILKPTNHNYVYVEVNTDSPVDWCNLTWYNSTGVYNISMDGSGTDWYKNMTDLEDYTYKFKVYCSDGNETDFRWVNVDTQPPSIVENVSPESPVLYADRNYTFNATLNDSCSFSYEQFYLDGYNYSLDDGLVLYLPFEHIDSSLKTPDLSGYSNNGTLYNFDWTNSSGVASGKLGKALSFDGVDDYVEISKPATADEITVAVWVYLTKTSASQGIVGAWTGWDPAKASYLIWSDPHIGIYVQWRVQGITSTSPALNVDDNIVNKWVFIVGTYSKSEGKLKLYLNGVKKAEADFNESIAYPDIPWYIGRYKAYYFGGTIDEVRIYNRALSEEEIKLLYERGRRIRFQNISAGIHNYTWQVTDCAGNTKNVTNSYIVSELTNLSYEADDDWIFWKWDYLGGVNFNKSIKITHNGDTIIDWTSITNNSYYFDYRVITDEYYTIHINSTDHTNASEYVTSTAKATNLFILELYNQTKEIYTFNIKNIMNTSFVLWLVLLSAGTFAIFLGISRKKITFLIISTILYSVSGFYSFSFVDIVGDAGVWVMVGLSLIGLVISFVYSLYATIEYTKQKAVEEW